MLQHYCSLKQIHTMVKMKLFLSSNFLAHPRAPNFFLCFSLVSPNIKILLLPTDCQAFLLVWRIWWWVKTISSISPSHGCDRHNFLSKIPWVFPGQNNIFPTKKFKMSHPVVTSDLNLLTAYSWSVFNKFSLLIK